MGIPLNKKHAIESASFIIVYEKPFPETVINSLVSLQETLKEDLPLYQPLNIIEFRIEQGGASTPAPSIGKVSGVFLQSVNPEGKQTWGLRVEVNTIILTAFDYENWDVVSNQAMKVLKVLGAPLFDQENPVTTVGYQVIDKFVSSASAEYRVSDVFNTKSEFLNKQVLSAGRLWHIFQGWFDESEFNKCRRLNVLNVATNDTVDGLVTSIDHNVQIQTRLSSSLVADEGWLRVTFNELHDANKIVVDKLLNSKQKKDIKLWPQQQ